MICDLNFEENVSLLSTFAFFSDVLQNEIIQHDLVQQLQFFAENAVKIGEHPIVKILADRSFLSGHKTKDEEEKFRNWVLPIYRKLIGVKKVKPIMEIVACSESVKIYYMPNHHSLI